MPTPISLTPDAKQTSKHVSLSCSLMVHAFFFLSLFLCACEFWKKRRKGERDGVFLWDNAGEGGSDGMMLEGLHIHPTEILDVLQKKKKKEVHERQ